jgi:hypothetical protein
MSDSTVNILTGLFHRSAQNEDRINKGYQGDRTRKACIKFSAQKSITLVERGAVGGERSFPCASPIASAMIGGKVRL